MCISRQMFVFISILSDFCQQLIRKGERGRTTAELCWCEFLRHVGRSSCVFLMKVEIEGKLNKLTSLKSYRDFSNFNCVYSKATITTFDQCNECLEKRSITQRKLYIATEVVCFCLCFLFFFCKDNKYNLI